MNSKKTLLAAFILIALVQLYVPAKMILNREEILNSGKEFKFKAAPIDPYDPFRGKYITLSYEENSIVIQNEEDWIRGETIYVLHATDNNGFVKIKSVSKEKPSNEQDFFKAEVRRISSDSLSILTIKYPFDRFYMEESKSYDAEQIYRKSLQDSNQVTYALVNIKDGEAVLKDILIDGISIREIAKAQQETKN